MAVDLATLAVRLDNVQAIAAAKETGAALEQMGAKGTAGATAVEQAILRQNTQLQQTANITAASTRSMGTFSAIEAEAAGHVGEHSLSLSRLERSLGSLTEHVLGLNPQMTLLAETFGRFALGSIEMVGILGAIAALSYAWQKLTADADAAEKKHTEFLKNVGDMANSAEAAKINTAAHTLLYGTPFDEKGNLVANSTLVAGAFKGSLADMEAEYAQIMAKIPKDATMVAGAIAEQLHDLVPKLDAARKEFHELQDAGNNLANQPSGVPGQMDPVKAHAESNAQILADDKKLADAGKALDDAGAASLQHSLNLVREYNQHTRDGMLADDKKAQEEKDRMQKDAENAFYDRINREDEAQKRAHEATVRLFESGLDDFFNKIRQKGFGAFTDLWSFALDGFEKMLEKMASQNIATSLAGYVGTAAVGGASATGAGGSISGGITAAISDHPYVAAAVGALTLGSAILSMNASNKAAEDQTRKMKLAYDDEITSIRVLLGQVSPLQKELADLDVQFDDLRTQAKALITSLDVKSFQEYRDRLAEINVLEAQRTIQLAEQAAVQAKYDEQDLAARLLAAQGHQSEADDLSFLTQQQKEYTDAVAAGKDALYLANLAEVQRAETIARTIAKLQTDITAFSNTIDGLKSFEDTLKLSPTAGLSPTDQLAEAQRQYQAVLLAAQTGDQGAAGRLPAAAQAYLDAAKQVYSSGTQFQDIFTQVLADTDATIKYYSDQRTIAQQQLDALKSILDAINVQTQAIITPKIVPVGGGGGTGKSGVRTDTTLAGDGTQNLQAITADGFSQLVQAVEELRSDVQANTRATRSGFEGAAL